MDPILEYKEDFLLDLSNNNYSKETIYNYSRDLEVFEAFLTERDITIDQVDKRSISLYKGFLRSGKHLAVIESMKRLQSIEMTGISEGAGSKGSRTNENLEDDLVDISEFGRTEISEPLSPRTINRMLSTLRSYLKYLVDYDLPCPVSADSVKLIKTERKESQVAELHELVDLVECPQELEKDKLVGLRNRAILELLFSTGMRISELTNLNREQLNEEGKIYVMGKGKKARFVYLTERARGILHIYLETRTDPYPALFIPYRGTRNSTKNPQKVRISTNYIQMKIKQYRQMLGIVVPTSAHSLRHGFATYLAENGANPAAIQRLLGHESLQTTTRYVHGSDKFAEESHRKYHPLENANNSDS